MFIETYYDERYIVPGGSCETAVRYPELAREELSLWQRYLPVTTELGNAPSWFYDSIPQPVIKQIEKAERQHLFERIEIWSRSGDPMAVGVRGGGDQIRYFSIARWGDAELTLEQIKRRLRVENWIFDMVPIAAALFSLVTILAYLRS